MFFQAGLWRPVCLCRLPATRLVLCDSTRADGDEGVSIYDDLRGKGMRPSAVVRAETSRLQRLSSAALPKHV